MNTVESINIFWLHANNQKYYKLTLGLDLFQTIYVRCSWGSLHSKAGGEKLYLFENLEEAQEKIRTIQKGVYKEDMLKKYHNAYN